MWNEDEQVLIFLTNFDFLNAKKTRQIIELFEKPKNLLLLFANHKIEVCKIIGVEHYNEILNLLDKTFIQNYCNNLEMSGVQCITINSENYPKKLLQLENPPMVLFCKGDISLLEKRGIAIVGARMPTMYGRDVTAKFARGLAENGLVIVSGLADGVDKISHETALTANGKTIAVLGSGFNKIYPPNNINLAKKIENLGLLVSEYRPSMGSTLYNFPNRNRIIAGLSDGVLITEAGEKSGALHTKEFALDLGKDVFAVPGNITSPKSVGTNRIIKSAQCACVTEYLDILNEFGITAKDVVKENKKSVNGIQKIILDILSDGDLHFDEIKQRAKIDTPTLSTYLTTMQINGIIKKLPSNYYCL
ncbi:MAG: DNA-processing protein DprA [Clostridia bacterium]